MIPFCRFAACFAVLRCAPLSAFAELVELVTQTLQSLLAEQIGDNDEESTQEVPDGSEDQGEQASAPHASPEKPV